MRAGRVILIEIGNRDIIRIKQRQGRQGQKDEGRVPGEGVIGVLELCRGLNGGVARDHAS